MGFDDRGVVVVCRRVKTRQVVGKRAGTPEKRRVAVGSLLRRPRAIAVAPQELNLRSQQVRLFLSVRPVARTIYANHLSDDARPSRHAHLDHEKMNKSFDRVGADVHA